MNDTDFTSGNHANSTVFNNPKDSDIILKLGETQFYAHRVVLRMWSPFFERSLSSQFSVATNAVFDLGDEEDVEGVVAMLKHMYGMPFGEHPSNKPYLGDWPNIITGIKSIVTAYVVADRYDCPSMRRAVADIIREELQEVIVPREETEEYFWLSPELFASICGLDAPRLADPALRDDLFDWLVDYFSSWIQDSEYREKLKSGTLLDDELNTSPLFELGKKLAVRGNK